MSIRKILLFIMLIALGLAALAGVGAVLLASGMLFARLAGTSILTAAMCGLFIPLSMLTDKPKTRGGGFTIMASVLFAWICVMATIWVEWNDFTWRLLSLAWSTLVTGIPIGVALLLANLRVTRVAAWAFCVLAGFAWLMAVVGTCIPDASWDLLPRIWGTGFATYGLGIPGCVLLANVGCGDRRYFRWLGLAANIVCISIALAGIWGDSHGEFMGRLAACCFVASVVLAHVNVLLMFRLPRAQTWMQRGTIVFSAVAGIATCAGILFQADSSDAMLFRIGAAGAIVAGCGTIALMIVAAINRRVDQPAAVSVTASQIVLQCPRCQTRQTLPIGDAACTNCQLQIFTRVVEPLCPACGYNLYQLTSNRCPECGAVIGPGEVSGPATTTHAPDYEKSDELNQPAKP